MSYYTTPTTMKLKQAHKSAQAAVDETQKDHAIIGAAFGTLGTNFHIVPNEKADEYMLDLLSKSSFYTVWIEAVLVK